MTTDHKAAKDIAKTDIATCEKDSSPYLLASCYLELRKLSREVLRIADCNHVAFNALRKALEETECNNALKPTSQET